MYKALCSPIPHQAQDLPARGEVKSLFIHINCTGFALYCTASISLVGRAVKLTALYVLGSFAPFFHSRGHTLGVTLALSYSADRLPAQWLSRWRSRNLSSQVRASPETRSVARSSQRLHKCTVSSGKSHFQLNLFTQVLKNTQTL